MANRLPHPAQSQRRKQRLRQHSQLAVIGTLCTLLAACSTTPPQTDAGDHSPMDQVSSHTRAHETAVCQQLLAAKPAAQQPGLPLDRLQVANWNIKKGSEPNWQQDLIALAEQSQLLLLQEAIPEPLLEQAIEEGWHFSFAEGYRAGELQTGVMTASQVPPLAECHLTAIEPWLRTPKATNFTRYPLSGSDQTLLVVNVHVVNFALGLTDFSQQLAPIQQILLQHEGPVILSGDFNTWRPGRQQRLDKLAEAAGLKEVNFEDDQRTHILGNHLDHIYVRELSPVSASTQAVTSSDHNPMTVTLVQQSAGRG